MSRGLGDVYKRQAAILGTNAAAFFGFDAEALRRVADRIGPRPTDVVEPPATLPDDYVGMGLR